MIDATTFAIGAAATIGIAVAAVGGYYVGYQSAVSAPHRLLRRAGRNTERCLSEAESAIVLAGRLCDAVANVCAVAENRLAGLIEQQNRLAESLGRLRSSAAATAAVSAVELEWSREPADPETGLPSRTAFEANAKALMGLAKANPAGGILLVAIDDTERLRNRIGETHYRELAKSIARVLCRSARDADLVCRLDGETYAILMRDADPADALGAAHNVREAFRKHPFRLGAEGPECLVTASFGQTPVLPSDELRLMTDRARAAVTRSRRYGRNRLHAYAPADSSFTLVKHLATPAQPHAESVAAVC
jgi:diguanylate cyclase (GGDEF)-like protein